MQPDMINTPDGIANVVDSPSLMSHSNEDASVHDNEPLTNGSDRLDSHPELNEQDSSHVDARTEAHAQADADAGANAEVQEVQNNTSSHRSSSSSEESTTEPSSNPNHNHKLAPSSSQSLSSSSSTSTSTLTSTASSSSSSSTPSLPRRCPVPPSLKFEGTVLPDIGEEDDVKSQAGGNGNNGFVMVTPGASSNSGGLRTPQLPDDASTVFTNDDESEYASENDLGSRAERRLESAKRRLTDMEGNLSLAQSSSIISKQSDEDDTVIPSTDNAAQQQQEDTQEQRRRSSTADETKRPTEARHTPPINEFVLPRLASSHSSSSSHPSGSNNGHETRNRQRTTSLAEALMRRSALNQHVGNSNSQSKNNANRNVAAGGDDRDSLLKGSHSTPQLKADSQRYLATARSSSAAELQPPTGAIDTQAGRLQYYPHRSRSAMTMHSAGAGAGPSSISMKQQLSSVPRKQPSSSFSYETRGEPLLLHAQNYYQAHQQRLHLASSTPILSSRYRHSRTPSGGSSARMFAAPTTPATRAEQVRELKDQVTDLKIKISTLKVKTQADSLRRRKSEHLNKNSKDPSERPSLFTDARQIGNGNGFMSHTKFKKGGGSMRIDRENPLGIIYGPVDRVQTRRPPYLNQPADIGRKYSFSQFDKLPPLEELNSPNESGRGGSIGAVRATNELQTITEQARNNSRYQRHQILSTNSADKLRNNKSGFTEIDTSYDQGYRRNSTSKSNFPALEGYDEFGFYGPGEVCAEYEDDEDEDEGEEEGQAIIEEWTDNGNIPSITRQGPDRRRASHSLEYHQKSRGIFKRAASAGDVYPHRRVTWSDDLGQDLSGIGKKSKKGTSRHLRRSKSAAIAGEINTEDRPSILRRAQSSTLHRKSQRFSGSTCDEWVSSSSESESGSQGVPPSDEDDSGHVTTPHEERADAFDYEHFFLNSALAHYAIQTDSEASVAGTEDDENDEHEEEEKEEEGIEQDGRDPEHNVAENHDDDQQSEVNGEGDSDNDSIKTAKNVGGQDNSPVSRRPSAELPQRHQNEQQSESQTADSKLLAPAAKNSSSPYDSSESLSTVMSYETATEGLNSEDNSDPFVDDGQLTRHKRDASDKTVTMSNPRESFGSSGPVRYKFSSIRNASSPTVLIQPRTVDGRVSSRASGKRSRSRTSNNAFPQMIDRGIQTSPEPQPQPQPQPETDTEPQSEPEPQSAKQTPVSSPTQRESSTPYQSPPAKIGQTPLRLHTETESLRSSTSARTTDSGTSASVSSATAPAAAPAEEAPPPPPPKYQAYSPHQSTLGSPLSISKRSVASSHTSLQGSPLPDLQEVVASLITSAANRFVPASVINNTARTSTENGEAAQPNNMGSPLTQLQDQDLARVSALFTSVGQLAFRLQVSLAEQEKQLAALPEQSPRTPMSARRPGTGQSMTPSMRATNVLRERLEAARRVLDGKLEIPSHNEMRR